MIKILVSLNIILIFSCAILYKNMKYEESLKISYSVDKKYLSQNYEKIKREFQLLKR